MLLDRDMFAKGAVFEGGEVHGDEGVRGKDGEEEEFPASPKSPLSADNPPEMLVAGAGVVEDA